MTLRLILGVDPGALGAVAWVDEFGALIAVEDTPTVAVRSGKTLKNRIAVLLFVALVTARRPDHAVVETAGAMLGQGISSTYVFDHGAGLLEGALAGMLVPVSGGTPSVWKKSMKLTSDKGLARQMAMRFWPAMANRFAQAKDDGRAEAALIALWGLRSGVLSAAPLLVAA